MVTEQSKETMCAEKCVKTGTKMVRPIMSMSKEEAHTRVLGLYRAFYRYIPYIEHYFDIPKSQPQMKEKIREYFYKNANVQDVRIIDILVMKGHMELEEITCGWAQKSHVMANWHPTLEPKRCDFVGKFLESVD